MIPIAAAPVIVVGGVAALAATDPTGGGLLQYGAIGILALLALAAVRVLFRQANEAAARDRARADRLEEELRKANAAMQDKALTTLAAATQAIQAALEVLGDERRSP